MVMLVAVLGRPGEGAGVESRPRDCAGRSLAPMSMWGCHTAVGRMSRCGAGDAACTPGLTGGPGPAQSPVALGGLAME